MTTTASVVAAVLVLGSTACKPQGSPEPRPPGIGVSEVLDWLASFYMQDVVRAEAEKHQLAQVRLVAVEGGRVIERLGGEPQAERVLSFLVTVKPGPRDDMTRVRLDNLNIRGPLYDHVVWTISAVDGGIRVVSKAKP